MEKGFINRLKHEEDLPESQAVKIFTGIYGVGPSVAQAWYGRGLSTLDDVQAGKGEIKLSSAQQVCSFLPLFCDI